MKITKSNKIANSIGDLSMVLTISVEETIATIVIGKAVGNNDGCIVDTSIGNEVGDDVGISDGIIDDKADGIKVGAIDGIGDVGLSVGNLDEIDGMVEGTSVGVTDGIRVGKNVGLADGMRVGWLDGVNEGNDVGARDG